MNDDNGRLPEALVQARIAAARASFDAADESVTWWLSFCDPERPRGTQFLGVAVVRAGAFAGHASMKAHALGCNPGGEVQMVQVPERAAAAIPGEYRDRLLSKDETHALDALVAERLRG